MILANLPDWLSECGMALVALAFIFNRLGLIAWLSCITRRAQPAQDSSSPKK
jgi:hypothetical protein